MLTARLESERRFHDEQAFQRARVLRADDYRFEDCDYLEHESWIAPAFARLGDLRGRRVLDLGCGHGMATVVLARRGAHVTGCDLSLGYVREARRRAAANDVNVDFIVCDGERLPFGDGTFERIWGNAVLHHLEPGVAGREIYRVLAPGGLAVFCEPWAGNRVLNWARAALPYPGKHRTADETPLRPEDLNSLREAFPRLRVEGHQLLAMLHRAVKQPRLARGFDWCDRVILRRWRHWQRYCRYVVVSLPK
jgi:SAM-dependent methyltransferase